MKLCNWAQVKANEILWGQRQEVLGYSFFPLVCIYCRSFQHLSMLMPGYSFPFRVESGYFFKLVTFLLVKFGCLI
jgi:hypothetical protein